MQHLKQYEFKPGMEKTPRSGRKVGTRNKISESFLRDLHAEWERSGVATLKILAVENPVAFAHLVAKVLPTAFDDEMPAVIRIVTGVPRHGEELSPEYLNRPPQAPAIPPAFPDVASVAVKEGDDAE